MGSQGFLARLGAHGEAGELGDFTTTGHVLPVTALAVAIGLLAAAVAFALLRLIGLFTNLFFFGRLSTALISPAGNRLGVLELLVPTGGALVVGLMARFGSERIRGHGIPEAIEAILLKGGRVEPKVALLKPLSAALSIGSGGPFGAEGPIIMTGGAFGSMVAQLFHLTSAERRTLLVAGAAAGMSATFASPVSAVLLAVELLLFEWKPRSFVPVAFASATAAAARSFFLGPGPLFPFPARGPLPPLEALAGCLLVGFVAGAFSALLTRGVYASEDAFGRLPIHWMWWPALGGLVIGLGGLVFPQALGVGYDVIGQLLASEAPRRVLLGILLVKSVIWAVSLGSGTSGGVLAPLLMMGGALGGLEAGFLPPMGAGFWPLVSMGALLGGTMRSPLTAVVFAFELTHDANVLLPLLIAATGAHAFTVLVLRRSILTEKVARRGYHLSREYSVDPLEILSVREVMRTDVAVLPAALRLTEIPSKLVADGARGQTLYPVVDAERRLVGIVTRGQLAALAGKRTEGPWPPLSEVARQDAAVAHPDEPLRAVVERMAATGITRLPVVERKGTRRLLGLVSLRDLLKARALNLENEQRRERVLPLRLRVPGRVRNLSEDQRRESGRH
ncbi:MAG: chloride channel protein [Acidithiobacillales bacterium]